MMIVVVESFQALSIFLSWFLMICNLVGCAKMMILLEDGDFYIVAPVEKLIVVNGVMLYTYIICLSIKKL